jgi:predicted nucleic acid-binding protein
MGASSVTVTAALAGVSSIAVDTAPFIYFIERHPAHVDVLRSIFAAVSTGPVAAVSSVITLVEVLTRPRQTGDTALELAYRNLLLHSRNFIIRDVDVATAVHAADLRAKYRLRTPDALQIATALVGGCDAFLTNDLAMRGVSEIRVLMLRDLTV